PIEDWGPNSLHPGNSSWPFVLRDILNHQEGRVMRSTTRHRCVGNGIPTIALQGVESRSFSPLERELSEGGANLTERCCHHKALMTRWRASKKRSEDTLKY